MKSIYVIQYDHIGVGGLGGREEARTHYFNENEKGEFIKKYVDLKDEWYVCNIRAYRSKQVEQVDIDSLLNF